jgi:Ca2+/Na+ antiporter
MKSNNKSKIIVIILTIILILAGLILYSEKIHKILLIENIKKVMNIRRK